MLIDEYAMVVKGLDFVSETDAKAILDTILDQLKDSLKATIADVWRTQEARDGIILNPLFCKGEAERRETRPFQVSESTRGIFAWVVEHGEPVWLENIRDQISHGYLVNKITDNRIENHRYFEIFQYTNSMIVAPIYYRERLRGLLSVESPVSTQFNKADLETLRDVALPTGILLWKLDAFLHNNQHTAEAIRSFRGVVTRSTTRLNPYRTGFIARPFQPEFEQFAKKLSDIFRAHRVRAMEYTHPPGRGVVISEMIQQVAAAHFGLADLTGLNPNVIVELGILMGLSKPFLLFRHAHDEMILPFDISGFHLYKYSLDDEHLRFWEPGQTEHRRAEDVVKAFIDNTLLADESFQHSREWVAGS